MTPNPPPALTALFTAPCSPLVSALFVEAGGCYDGLPTVDAWPEQRDARLYRGPLPVVAHPPCQRWGRFWHGSTRKPHQFRLGEDSGCFAAALTAVRNYGGILEHPAGSLAWQYFGLGKPKCGGGWVKADEFGGWTCQVDQRHYGHTAPKPTWLYAVRTPRPELKWEKSDRTPPAWMIERYGERKARKIGAVAMIGGKDKTRIRNATPLPFRDLLLGIAQLANVQAHARGGAAASLNEGVKRGAGAAHAASPHCRPREAWGVPAPGKRRSDNATPKPHRVGCSALLGLLFICG